MAAYALVTTLVIDFPTLPARAPGSWPRMPPFLPPWLPWPSSLQQQNSWILDSNCRPSLLLSSFSLACAPAACPQMQLSPLPSRLLRPQLAPAPLSPTTPLPLVLAQFRQELASLISTAFSAMLVSAWRVMLETFASES